VRFADCLGWEKEGMEEHLVALQEKLESLHVPQHLFSCHYDPIRASLCSSHRFRTILRDSHVNPQPLQCTLFLIRRIYTTVTKIASCETRKNHRVQQAARPDPTLTADPRCYVESCMHAGSALSLPPAGRARWEAYGRNALR